MWSGICEVIFEWDGIRGQYGVGFVGAELKSEGVMQPASLISQLDNNFQPNVGGDAQALPGSG